MLLREHQGRRDEHRLMPGADGLHHRRNRHDGFAGSHFALQQPSHRMVIRHIAGDIVDDRLLASRQIERQGRDELVFQRDVGAYGGGRLLRGITRLDERGLANQRLLIAQCVQCLFEMRAVDRIMNRHERLGTVHQSMLLAQRLGNDVRNRAGQRLRLCFAIDPGRIEFPVFPLIHHQFGTLREVVLPSQHIHAFQHLVMDMLAGNP